MALSRHHSRITRPLSVQEIVAEAQDFEFSTDRPLKSWLRSAQMLLTEASICEEEDNLQTAYLYVYRHAELILGKLSQHPDIKSPSLKDDLSRARKQVNKDLVKLEKWKPRINADHASYLKVAQRRREERARLEQQRLEGSQLRRLSLDSHDGSPMDQYEALNAFENRQLAVSLARQELRRRNLNRQARSNGGLSRSIQETGRLLERNQEARVNLPTERRGDSYHYPAVPVKEQRMDWSTEHSQDLPALPPKTSYDPSVEARNDVEQKKVTFKITAHAEAGQPLRTVFLPPTLRQTFLNLADQNTARNLETCGVLCATSVSNALFISHLVIPDQTSTSDTCDTSEEGDVALFDFCDKENLLVCGWIHTHPSQTCFLSSRDLHTSAGYQQMLPEAIAIVCAPRHNPDWGVFRLTDPPGLPAVIKCHATGLFHPHSENNLYTDANGQGIGHVVEGPGLKFEVVDLRKKS